MNHTRILILAPLLLLAACSSSNLAGDSADIRGTITSANLGDGPSGTILIEGTLESDTKYDKASVRITPETKIMRREGGRNYPVGAEALKTGERVQATFTGPIAKSYPLQAAASVVIVLERAP